MGPLGGRGWHPISRVASPLLDVPIPPQIQTCPSPADTPQGSPTPTPSLTPKPLPTLPPPAQPPAASPLRYTSRLLLQTCTPPPFCTRPSSWPEDPPPLLLWNPSSLAQPAFSELGGRCGWVATRAPPVPLPSRGEGRTPFIPGALGPASPLGPTPFVRMLNASWEEGAGPSGAALFARSGQKRGRV